MPFFCKSNAKFAHLIFAKYITKKALFQAFQIKKHYFIAFCELWIRYLLQIAKFNAILLICSK